MRIQHTHCTIPGCDKPHEARGLCPMHYRRWRLYGDVDALPGLGRKKCSIDSCAREVISHGLCSMHWQRQIKHGDPLYVSETSSNFQHGHRYGNAGKETPTHMSWRAMLRRVTNPHDSHFADYGGRGITVCDRWRDFVNFLSDLGDRPEGMTLDRLDNDKGYGPDNCRWATRLEQSRNQRRNAGKFT